MATVGLRHHSMLIDGEPVDSEAFYEIRSPATEAVICTVAKGSVEHADAAVLAARRAFDSGVWSRKLPEERAAILTRIAIQLGDELDELTELEISANGATIRQALAFHTGLAAPHFLHFAELAATYEWERPIPTTAYPTMSANTIRREPIGVCAAIVPWNFPLLLGLWKIAPALAAGNSVVVKPDEKTPLSLLRLVEIAHECGVPPGILNLVTGDGEEVGARLAAHPEVDKIAFTGSTTVGREVMRLAAQTIKHVSLELGGKGPAIVLEDADLEIAVDGALFACMLYSGQMCESGTRLLVPAAIYDTVIERLVARARTIKLGDPTSFDTDMGPVISAAQRDRILAYIEAGKAEGARVVLGGGVPDGSDFERGFWVEPTIFADVRNDMRIAREEIFGPVLSVLRYDTVEEAIAIANDCQYGLSAGVWGADYEAAMDVGKRLRAGTVWINNWHMVTADLPFGGYKQSGLGREVGPDALDEYTEAKHLHLDLTRTLDRHVFDLVLSEPPAS